MTVPIYQSFTEAKTGTVAVSQLTINKPTGVVETDLMVVVVVLDGFGVIADGDWTRIQRLSSPATSISVLYKVAGESEPSSYTFTWSGGGDKRAYGFIMRITGHDTTAPINNRGVDYGVSAAPTCPSVTTTKDDCLILRIFGADDDDRTLDGGEPSGTTVITVDDTDDGLYGRGYYGDGYYGQDGAGECSGGAAYESQVTAGATGTAAFSLTASEEWIAITVAILPASAVSASPSASISASVSASPSSTPSASVSTSPSASISASPSATVSASISASISASLSSSPSGTASASPSASISSSPSASPSRTPSASVSASPSRTPSASPSASASVTPSASKSASVSASPSASISVSPSGTASASPSGTPSASPSVTPSGTPSASISATPTGSPSASPSASPSVSGDELDTTEYTIYTTGGTVQKVENTFTNLEHLEGETVTIQGTDVDDNTIEYDNETVSSGIVTLMELDPHAHNFVRKAVIGLPSRYIVKPMRLDITTRGGTTKGSIKKFAEVVVSFLNTLGAQYGEDTDNLHDFTDTFGTTLYTGDKTAVTDGGFGVEDNFVISGDGPFPCTVRAIIPRVDKTGR